MVAALTARVSTRSELEALMPAVEDLARRAGVAVMEVYSRADHGVTAKDDRSPLTEADLASHRCIIAGLREIDATIPVLSEESADIPVSERRAWQRYWLVDPLDGTKEFLKRNGEFTVNIALIDGGDPVLGVVHAPALAKTWAGGQGFDAWVEEDGQRRPIKVQPAQRPYRVAASRSHGDPRTAAFLQRAGEVQAVSMGSSLKFCLVAEGRIDLYPRFAPTSEWDTAAAQAVLEAAGGQVLDLRLGSGVKPLRYNQRDSLLNGDFLAVGDAGLPWREWLDLEGT